MTDDQVAEIACGLTKAQRAAVVRGQAFTRTGGLVFAHKPALFGSVSWSRGEAFLNRPTDLGLRVRAYLLANS